jgi:zinc protease
MIPWVASALAAPLPSVPPPVPWTPPAVEVRSLSNGVPVFVLPRRPTGLVDVRLVLKVGEPSDPPGLEGLAATALDLADEAAGGKDAATFAAAVRATGARLAASTTGDTSTIAVVGVRRNLATALDLWSSVALAPALSDDDLRVVRQRRVDRITLQQREPAGLADRIQARLQYGDGYVGRSATEASLAAIDAAAVRDWWSAHVGPGAAAIVAGGDVSADDLLPLLEARLGAWSGGAPVAVDAVPVPVTGETLVLVDLPGAPQSAVRAFFPVGPIGDPSRAALDVADEALGGAFTSRVNLNLREDKGWTYGARCNVVYRAGPGFVECGALVRADATAGAVTELRRELADILADRPLGGDEVARYRDASIRGFASDHETTSSLLAEVARSWVRGLPPDAMNAWLRSAAAVTTSSADAALRAHLAPDRVTWLVVGDMATLRPSLESLGLPVVDPAP